MAPAAEVFGHLAWVAHSVQSVLDWSTVTQALVVVDQPHTSSCLAQSQAVEMVAHWAATDTAGAATDTAGAAALGAETTRRGAPETTCRAY